MRTKTLQLVFLLALLNAGRAMTQEQLPEIRVTPIDEQLTKLWVNGYVNVLLLQCEEQTILIDAGFEETAAQLASKLNEMGVYRVDYLINTHADGDHTGGNGVLGKDGTIVSHSNCKQSLAATEGFANAGLPSTAFQDSLRLRCGSSEIVLIAMPGGHTNGDVVIHLPDRNMVYLGDIIVAESFPVVWLEYGDGVGVERLSEVLADIIARFPVDTRFLSAHGRDYSMEDLIAYHEMVVSTIDLVRSAMEIGKTVDEMQADNLLGDWASWNSQQWDWINTDFWIDTVYRSLSR